MTESFTMQNIIIDSVSLPGSSTTDFDRRQEIMALGAGGTIHETFFTIKRESPKISFNTISVKALLAILSLAGVEKIPFKKITTGLDFNLAKMDGDAPAYETTGHLGKRLGAGSMLYLNGLNWSNGGNGLEASCDCFGLSADGTTSPVTDVTGVLTTSTDLSLETFGLYSLTVGGVTIANPSSVGFTIEHMAENNVVDQCFNADLPYPTMVTHAGANGQCKIRGNITLGGLVNAAIPNTGTMVAVFKQYDFGGGFSATSSITVTLLGGFIQQGPIKGSNGAMASRDIVVMPRWDGTNKPLTIVVA